MSYGVGRRDNPQYHRRWCYRSFDKARLGSLPGALALARQALSELALRPKLSEQQAQRR
jgi:hypothetical protein